jgi:xanthine dehydrogenase accessory factor
VVMTETARPSVVRRTVAFAEAVYQGCTEVQGVEGVLVDDEGLIADILSSGAVAVVVDPEACIRSRLRPHLLVDAIMAKRNLGTCLTDAPGVVALGPGFVAGRDVHAVIETMRGPDLGRVILEGEALPDTGIPAERNGLGRERVLRSPGSGLFVPLVAIGDRVGRGDVVGLVDGLAVRSGLAGIVRGMLHEGLVVDAGFKLGDVDPAAAMEECYLVSDKALAIGDGVVEASRRLLGYPLGSN